MRVDLGWRRVARKPPPTRIHTCPPSAMGRPADPWDERHARIREALRADEVAVVVRTLQSHAAAATPLARLLRELLPHDEREEHILGVQLDCALAALWCVQNVPRGAPLDIACAPALARMRELDAQSLQIGDFASLCTLQHGGTGTVEVVRCRFDRRLYVLKSTVKGIARREASRFSPVLESQLLARGASNTPQLHAAFQSARSVHLVLEYFPAGDLDALLQAAAAAGPGYRGKARTGLLLEAWVLRYAADMVAALAWLHALRFCHRDVKPSNFLLDRSGRLKLCDFATCAPFAEFGRERRVLAYFTQRPAGTCDYIAPEVLHCEEERLTSPAAAPAPDEMRPGAYGPAVDWWGLGVVLYEMVFGRLPFWAPQPADVYERIAHHEDYFTMDEHVACSPALRALIAALVCAEPQRLGRRATEDICSHAAFADVEWDRLDKSA